MQYETVENLYFIIIIVCDLATGRERQLTTGIVLQFIILIEVRLSNYVQ